ncbi:MAG: twin-arginine translocase subunit TatC [Chthonomonadales bacterium]|nr:twin-arginine translocase subunit TatC [Chthonomonadales bacterium]
MAVVSRPPGSDQPGYDEKRMELTEHLGELRTRIVRCLLYLAVSAAACYLLFQPIYGFLFRPMAEALVESKTTWTIAFPNFTEAFFVVLQISVIAGAIVVSPLITMEMWGFIAPALTPRERRPLRFVAPLSVVLFVSGAVLSYWLASFAIDWFLGYLRMFPGGAVLYQNPRTYVLFILKLMGAFGLVFQLPVVLMFLAWAGILQSQSMVRSWRYAIVGISLLGAVVTPSNDAFTMVMMTIPVIVLYVGSIWLVRLIERRRERERAGGA